jgi:hypothetical protein
MQNARFKAALTATVALVAFTSSAGVAGAGTRVPDKPAGVEWNGVHFSTPADLRAWLGARGVRYRDWLRRHPGSAYLWTHPRRPALPVVQQPTLAAPVLASPAARSGAPRWLYAVVGLLLLLAVTPSRLLAPIVPGRSPYGLAAARTAIAAAALSVGLGILIASAL